MRKFSTLLLFLLISVSFKGLAQDAVPEDFDERIIKVMQEDRLPGLAIAVVRNDSLVFLKGYGVRELDTSESVDAHTLFQAASLTKTFTAALMGMLVDQGRVAWDDPVKKYIENLKLQDDYVTENLTIRDILSVRSGIRDGDALQAADRKELIGRLQNRSSLNSFRSAQTSFNLMYTIAGYIAETLYEKPWEQIIEETILDPLGMTETFTDNASAFRSTNNIAAAHILEGRETVPRKWGDYALFAPAAGLVTNVTDLAKWIRFLLNKGTWKGSSILSEKVLDQMHTPQMMVGEFFRSVCNPHANFMTFGFGWFISDYKGRKLIEMEGAAAGATNVLVLVPSENIGFVIQTNRDFAFKSLLSVKFYLLDFMLSNQPG